MAAMGSNGNDKPFLQIQDTLKQLTQGLQHETDELHRLEDTADRRMRKPPAPVKPVKPKKR